MLIVVVVNVVVLGREGRARVLSRYARIALRFGVVVVVVVVEARFASRLNLSRTIFDIFLGAFVVRLVGVVVVGVVRSIKVGVFAQISGEERRRKRLSVRRGEKGAAGKKRRRRGSRWEGRHRRRGRRLRLRGHGRLVFESLYSLMGDSLTSFSRIDGWKIHRKRFLLRKQCWERGG